MEKTACLTSSRLSGLFNWVAYSSFIVFPCCRTSTFKASLLLVWIRRFYKKFMSSCLISSWSINFLLVLLTIYCYFCHLILANPMMPFVLKNTPHKSSCSQVHAFDSCTNFVAVCWNGLHVGIFWCPGLLYLDVWPYLRCPWSTFNLESSTPSSQFHFFMSANIGLLPVLLIQAASTISLCFSRCCHMLRYLKVGLLLVFPCLSWVIAIAWSKSICSLNYVIASLKRSRDAGFPTSLTNL